MRARAGLNALVVTAVLTLSGCSAPPIAADVAQELQCEVRVIAVLTARGDTVDAVTAAQTLSVRVRKAQSDGQITGERAVMILQRVDQLIERLLRSGAAPAPVDLPEPFESELVPTPVIVDAAEEVDAGE